MTTKKNTVLLLILVLTMAMIPTSVFAESDISKNQSINSELLSSDIGSACKEVTINKELDQLIMNMENEVDKQKVIEYFYTTAYEKTIIIDESEIPSTKFEDSISLSTQNNSLKVGKELVSLSGDKLDDVIRNLVKKGATNILNMPNIKITNEYLDYANDYVTTDTMNKLISKAKSPIEVYELADITGSDYSNQSGIVQKATTSHTKTFKKEYGSPSGAAYTMFKITATWKQNGTSITSLSTSGQTITTPSYMQTTLQKSKTSRSGKYGYVQRGWGYVNLFYMDGRINGYFIIDVKLQLKTVKKQNLTTLSPGQWNSYSWG